MNVIIDISTECNSKSLNPQTLLLEENLKPTIEKMQNLWEEKYSQIAIPTVKYWFKEFTHESYLQSTYKILAVSAYLGLLSIGAITTIASLNLLFTSDSSPAFSSDVASRVDYANRSTNSAAVLSYFTDFPAFTFLLFLMVIKKTYIKTLQDAVDKSYNSCVNENIDLTPEMHEELYQRYIAELIRIGVEKFYMNPDRQSETGAIHHELAATLEEFEKEASKISFKELIENCSEAFKKDHFAKKVLKITGGSLCLCFMALATFLILENCIIIKDTPVRALFSSNKTEQINEAFDVTQLGGLFSSLTTFGAAVYVFYHLFFRNPYNITRRNKINDCFTIYYPKLSVPTRNAFFRIKEIKLRGLV